MIGRHAPQWSATAYLDGEEVEVSNRDYAGLEPRPDAERPLPTLGKVVIDQINPTGRFKGVQRALTDWMLRQDARRNLY